jgi:hypothetical protein
MLMLEKTYPGKENCLFASKGIIFRDIRISNSSITYRVIKRDFTLLTPTKTKQTE